MAKYLQNFMKLREEKEVDRQWDKKGTDIEYGLTFI